MLLNEIAEIIQDAGLGQTGVSIFIGQRPPTVENAIVLNQYGGGPP